jgi:hypothetical protein
MLYKELDTDQIVLPPNSQLSVEIDNPIILVPMTNQRVFLNWFTDKGSLHSTHTITKSIKVTRNVTLVNPDSSEIRLLKITESIQK